MNQKLTKEIEDKIRYRYENGESLKSLAIIYKIPLITIKRRKAKRSKEGDSWIKHSLQKNGYELFKNDLIDSKNLLEEAINTKARDELDELESLKDRAYSEQNTIFDEALEEAHLIRSTRIKRTLGLRKEIEKIYSDKEKIELALLKLEAEKRKVEIQLKQIELENKSNTADSQETKLDTFLELLSDNLKDKEE